MKDRQQVVEEFRQLVNMSEGELAQWLDTPESQHTGMTREGESEAQGHKRWAQALMATRTAP
jgi:hypothetical protein